MALVPYTVTALAESDADGTGGSNIVAGAVVIFYKNAVAQTLYDNAAGSNPSLSKTTDAQGQITVFIESGVYDIELNGGISRGVNIGAEASITLTTDNTNLTEFGGDGVNDVIAAGEAIGSTTAYFYLPVNLTSIPSSISVTTPFRVTDTNSVLKASGVTAVALTANSSNKLVRLQVTGLSGLVAGESLELRTDTSTAKITVVP